MIVGNPIAKAVAIDCLRTSRREEPPLGEPISAFLIGCAFRDFGGSTHPTDFGEFHPLYKLS